MFCVTIQSIKQVSSRLYLYKGLPGGSDGKESACQCRRHKRRWFDPLVGKIPRRRKWQPTPIFLPGKFHGQRSLAGCNPWGGKELDMTERLHNNNGGDADLISGSGRSPGGGNGNPLPYSCLENSMNRGTWWPTVHRVTKSQTQLSN